MIWRFVGRFIDLNPLGGAPKPILNNEPTRAGIFMLNVGAGIVRITDKANRPINIPADGFPILQNMMLSPSVVPYGPTNEIWATGEAGHDLYVMEIIAGPNVRKQS